MSLPLTLYEYVALLVPGVVGLYVLTGIPVLTAISFSTDKTGEIIALGILAFLWGHVAQAMGRALFMWLRWRLPWLRNPKVELLRRTGPIPDPVTWLRTRWFLLYCLTHGRIAQWFWNLDVDGDKPVQVLYEWVVDWPFRFVSFVLLRWPQEPMFPEWKIKEIKNLVQPRLSGKTIKEGQEGLVFSECLSAVKDDLKQYDLFSAQADLFRGLVFTLLVLETVSVIYGPPLLQGASVHQQRWYMGIVGYLILVFIERHQHFEYNAARVVYNTFLERERKAAEARLERLMGSKP